MWSERCASPILRIGFEAGKQPGLTVLDPKRHPHWRILSAAVFVGLLTGGAWLVARAEATLVRTPRARTAGMRLPEGDHDLAHESALERTEFTDVDLTSTGQPGPDDTRGWNAPPAGVLTPASGKPLPAGRFLVPLPPIQAPDTILIRRLSARGPPPTESLLPVTAST